MLIYTDDPVDGMAGLRPFVGAAKKITIHTTETSVKPNWQEKRKGLPHYTLDGNKVYRHLKLDVAAYTMGGGDASPNSGAGVNIQIEWVGFAKDSAIRSDEDYAALAELLYDISTEIGCPFEFPRPFPKDNTVDVRLAWAEYEGVSGILGHCHAPWNTHWDPGALDVERIKFLRPYSGGSGVDYEELLAAFKLVGDQLVASNVASLKAIAEKIDTFQRDLTAVITNCNSSISALNKTLLESNAQLKLALDGVSKKVSSIRLVVDP